MAEGSHERRSAVVVGASGFLGSALRAELTSRGAEVRTATLQDPVIDASGALRADLHGAGTFYWGASRINPLVAVERPELVAADLRDLERFLDALERASTDATVVLLSSGGTVYGAAEPPHREATPPQPTSAYGKAKLAMEHVATAARVRSVVLRISNAYGPGQRPAPGQGVIGHWLRALLSGSPVTVYGDLSTTRDYLFGSDLIGLLADLHGNPLVPPLLNVGSGEPTSLGQVLDAVHAAVGSRQLNIEFEARRPFDLTASWLDVGLAERSLGWRASTPLHEGVEQMWRWLLRGGA